MTKNKTSNLDKWLADRAAAGTIINHNLTVYNLKCDLCNEEKKCLRIWKHTTTTPRTEVLRRCKGLRAEFETVAELEGLL